MGKPQETALWAHVHAERAALAEDLAGLSPEQWRAGTLCSNWNVEQVVAHLTAAASLNRWRWIRSMVGARFRPEVHNLRRLTEHRGSTPAETLARFQAVINNTVAPTSHTAAFLGEVVVHAQDIRRPLGLARTPGIEALTPVAEFFARRDFAVPSRRNAAGLHLQAGDGPFSANANAGAGAQVTGPTLALVMVMAGRGRYLDELSGSGVEILRDRLG